MQCTFLVSNLKRVPIPDFESNKTLKQLYDETAKSSIKEKKNSLCTIASEIFYFLALELDSSQVESMAQHYAVRVNI